MQEKFANNLQKFEDEENVNNKIVSSKIELSQNKISFPRSEVFPKTTLENVQIENKNQNARREEHDFKRGGANREREKPDIVRRYNRGDRRQDIRRRPFERNFRPYNNRFGGRYAPPVGRYQRRSRSKSRRRPRHSSRSRRRSRSRDRSSHRRRHSSDRKRSHSKSRSRSKSSKTPPRKSSPIRTESRSPEKLISARPEQETPKVESQAEKMKRRAEKLLILKKKMELEMELRRKEAEEKRKEQAVS